MKEEIYNFDFEKEENNFDILNEIKISKIIFISEILNNPYIEKNENFIY